jgi:chromosome segregation protein
VRARPRGARFFEREDVRKESDLQLKRLELLGFKSFMTRAQLEFGEGITAILGPNGCGKTNLVDSVRWVLGSQSPKQLRGASMENVIFSGTRARPPLGMAEVHLTLSNEEGKLPTDFQEITVSRKGYRDGPSEFLINRVPCRLKDIRDLFLDTGLGNQGYAIIERDMIDTVLNDSLGQRRFFLDEAAGIMKYRQRREEARRKLKLVQQDLLRLNDIVEEVGRQTRSLKYQMGKARRYQRLKERLDAMERHLSRRRLRDLLLEEKTLRDEVEKWDGLAGSLEAKASEMETRLEERRTDSHEVEERYETAHAEVQRIRSQLKEAEGRVLVLNERIESLEGKRESARREMARAVERLEELARERDELSEKERLRGAELEEVRSELEAGSARLEGLQREFTERRERLLETKRLTLDFLRDEAVDRSRLESLERSLAEMGEERDRLRDESDRAEERRREQAREREARVAERREAEEARERLEKEIARLEERLEELAGEEARDQAEEKTLASALEGLRGRVETLERLIEEHGGYGAGARWILGLGDGRVLGALAGLVRVPERYRAAAEVVLERIMEGIVVEDRGAALEMIEELRRGRRGRAHLFYPPDGKNVQPPVDVGGLEGTLLDHVEGDERAVAALRPFLRGVLVARDTDSALGYLDGNGNDGRSVVTLEGILFRGRGQVSAGAAEPEETDLLGRRERVEALKKEVGERSWELDEVRARVAMRGEERETIKRDLERLEAERDRARGRGTQIEVLCARAEEAVREREEELARLESARRLVEDRESEALGRASALRARLEQDDRSGSGPDLEAEEAAVTTLERERDTLRGTVNDARVRFASLQAEMESLEERRRSRDQLEEEFARIRREKEEEAEATVEGERELKRLLEETRGEARARSGEEEAATSALEEIRDGLARERDAIETAARDVRRVHEEARGHRDNERDAQVRQARLAADARNLVERVRDSLGEDWEPHLRGVPIEVDEDTEWTAEDLAETRRKIETLGPVNLLALEEYEEKSERLAFLEKQYGDLVAARDSLEKAIVKINRRAKERFLFTYGQVRRNFQEIFTTLFEGGEVDLTFVDSEDPLEADIQITASPRGKKLQHISLLSGGESTLTALAYLFAVYMVKPSPFCLLDEVDAPLDDANIERFVRMIRRFSDDTQFVLITHNKLTMEAAEHLYGVSMEEPGISRLVSVSFEEGSQLLEDSTSAKDPQAMAAS